MSTSPSKQRAPNAVYPFCPGIALVLIGCIHNCVALFIKNRREALYVMVQNGIFNTGNLTVDTFCMFWFIFAGISMMTTGAILREFIKETNKPLPSKVGVYLSLSALFVVIFLPKGGAWLTVVLGIYVFIKGRK